MWGRSATALAICAVGCATPPPAAPRVPGGDRIALTVTDRGTLLVPVSIDGAPPELFVVDTGASITALTPAAAARANVTAVGAIPIHDATGKNPAGGIARVDLAIGRSHHQHHRVVVVELPEAGRLGQPIGGVLGLDVLARHDIVLDLPARSFALHPAGALSGLRAADFARTGLSVDARRLYRLHVELDELPMVAVLDLGAQHTVMNLRAAAALGGTGGPARASRTGLGRHWLRIGDTTLAARRLMVGAPAVFARHGLVDEPAVILGADVFRGRAVGLLAWGAAMLVSRE